MFGRAGAVEFIGMSSLSTTAVNPEVLALPAGSRVGDLCYAALMYNQPGTPSGFTMLANWPIAAQAGQYLRHGYKVLDAADITAGSISFPAVVSGSGYLIAVWRGPTSIASRGFSEGNGASISHLGFSPAAGSRGVFTIGCDRDGPVSWSVAAPFTKEGQSPLIGIYGLALGYVRPPANYAGENAVWSGMTSANTNVAGLLELL
jgi:hypothetical protein